VSSTPLSIEDAVEGWRAALELVEGRKWADVRAG